MKINRLFAAIFSATMLLASCGGSQNQNSTTDSANNSATTTDGSTASNNSGNATKADAQKAMIPGKLNFVNLKDGEQPVMTALTLKGNQVGSAEWNDRKPATEGIRCIFNLNEWIEFYPVTNAEYGIKVWIIKHKEDQSFYLKNKMRDITPGFVQGGDIRKDPDAEEGSAWGSMYVNPDNAEPGYYDFVFTYEDKVFATMLTKFYKESELDRKSDDELTDLM
ncbi:MAG: hypothetical protein IIT37_07090, partial [Bacteroidales bacterium]|nr:hypothetical protein [Bacteroidales bacterium]